MGKFIDLTGQQFGRLIVIRRMDNSHTGRARWLYRCSCIDRNETIVQSSNLRSSQVKSCGCLSIEKTIQRFTKHGYSQNNKTYKSWQDMIQRCTNPNNQDYHNYGGRGITICERWLKFENFLNDTGKSRKLGLTLERKDNNKGYCKENCKWATRKEQNRNKRNNLYVIYKNKKRLIVELAEEFGIDPKVLRTRICRGWSIEKALKTPIRKRKNNG